MMVFRILAIIALSYVISACRSKPAVQEETTEPPVAEAPAAAPTAATAATPANPLPWSYEGDKGAQSWASINPDYILCGKGKNQSPINLKWKKPTQKGPRMDFSYGPSAVRVENLGYTAGVNVSGNNQLLYKGQVYRLEKMEFHSPSEHNLSGNSLAMEMQLIHKAVNGDKIAIVSIFGIEGNENSMINMVLNKLMEPPSDLQIDLAQIIPPSRTHYNYVGSLTTPPCSEGVEWIIFNTPMELSRDQIMAFRSKFPANNRPLQESKNRKVNNY